jgi:hypothetical protein
MRPSRPIEAAGSTATNLDTRNPHALKVRRLQQTLFLREMERLADAMCRHYGDARTDVDSVAVDDIRTHVDTIHDRVHHVIERDLVPGNLITDLHASRTSAATLSNASPGGSSLKNGTLRSQLNATASTSAAAEGNGDAIPVTTTDPRSGYRPQAPREDWTAQEARGVSLRLRQLMTVSVAGMRQYRSTAQAPAAGIQVVDEPLLKVRRFEFDNPSAMALLDMNMDNNTSCLSARRKATGARYAVHDSIRSKEAALSVKPLVPALRLRHARPLLATSGMNDGNDDDRDIAVEGHHTVTHGPKPPVTWSPRDVLALEARSARVRQQHSNNVAELQLSGSERRTSPRLPALRGA